MKKKYLIILLLSTNIFAQASISDISKLSNSQLNSIRSELQDNSATSLSNDTDIDINKTTGLIDEIKLEDKMDEDTAGVIITHLYSESSAIKNFINKFENKITIIEDAAINFGAKLEDRFLGTLGHYGFYSFALVKNLNTFTGGALYIKDKEIFDDYILKRKTKKFPFLKTMNLLFTTIIIKTFFNNISYQIFHYFLKLVYLKKIELILKKIYPILFHKLEDKIPDIYSFDFNWSMNDLGIYNLKKIKKGMEKSRFIMLIIQN